jgi:hypothetical protein
LLAKAVSNAMTRARAEYGLGADATCSACAGAMLEQARAAGIPDVALSDWLRRLADGIEAGGAPDDLPEPKMH